MLQKPLKGGQSKEDEMDCGESEEEAAFGEIDNVCHQVEIFNAFLADRLFAGQLLTRW